MYYLSLLHLAVLFIYICISICFVVAFIYDELHFDAAEKISTGVHKLHDKWKVLSHKHTNTHVHTDIHGTTKTEL